MPTVKLGTSSPAVKTKKNDTVTWELTSPTVHGTQYLRVEVTSPFFETISGKGKEGEDKVDLKMSFHDGTTKDAVLSYSLYLVTPGSPPPSEVPVTPGPSLVIDTIGPPPGPSCRPYDEDEPVAE